MARTVPEDAKRLTLEEYLELEERADTRHEFVDGFMFAMAGGTDNHNQIVVNIATAARTAARGTPCRVHAESMKLVTPSDKAYYPDVFATCEEANDGSRFKRHPCLIVEVLSESTEAIDRGEKLHHYQTIGALQTYVLVSQHARLVETYTRLPDGAWRYEKTEGEGRVTLARLGLTLTLEDIYEDASLGAA